MEPGALTQITENRRTLARKRRRMLEGQNSHENSGCFNSYLVSEFPLLVSDQNLCL